MEIIAALMAFANRCDRKKENLSLWISSDGHAGVDEPMGGTTLSPTIRGAAAQLGPEISRRTVKLEITKARAEAYISDIGGFEEKEETDQYILSLLALLSLRARWIVDMAAKTAGLSISHAPEELERLLAEGSKHSHVIDSGDELRWY